jgi:hypothetical protein
MLMRRFVCLVALLGTFSIGLACGLSLKLTGRYQETVLHEREAILKEDLTLIRAAIKQYTSDKALPPQSLDDLVRAAYLRQIPVDPITEQRNLATRFRCLWIQVQRVEWPR